MIDENKTLANELDLKGDKIYQESDLNDVPNKLFKAYKAVKVGHGLKPNEGQKLRQNLNQHLMERGQHQ